MNRREGQNRKKEENNTKEEQKRETHDGSAFG